MRTGWFWAFVLLAIPNCTLDSGPYPCVLDGTCVEECEGEDCPPCEGEDCPPCEGEWCPPDPCVEGSGPGCPTEIFEPGTDPVDAIMCEIPEPISEGMNSSCASADEAMDSGNVSLVQAATALANGHNSIIALDRSPGAIDSCGGFKPRKYTFLGAALFPQGLDVCINYAEKIGTKYATPAAACAAKCEDLINFGSGFKPANVAAYCAANARVATNYDPAKFANVCTAGGNLDLNTFVDPRWTPEPVIWTDTMNVEITGPDNNGLARTLPASGMNLTDWNAGAASTQVITKGDAWVDFSSPTLDGAHAVGVRESRDMNDVECVDVSTCPDGLPGLDTIGFAIDLNHVAEVYVIETVPSFASFGPFGTYAAGERFRIHITDNYDGTATISYARVVGPCVDGQKCDEDPIGVPATVKPRYPLRIDASFRDPSAFASVNVVRIKQ